MAPPPLIPVDCPPGLEYLTTIDSLFVKQKVELLEGKSLCSEFFIHSYVSTYLFTLNSRENELYFVSSM